MKRFLFLFAILLFLFTTGKLSAVNDSCLTPIWPHNPPDSYNPDYILKDTCKDSPTYGQWYARGTFLVAMKEYIFSRLIVANSSATIFDIDSINHKAEYEAYKYLDEKYGKISFYRDYYECNNDYDSEFIKAPCLDVKFSRYNLRTDLINGLKLVLGTIVAMTKRQPHPSDVEENYTGFLELKPNPCYDRLKVINLEEYEVHNTKVIIYDYIGEIMKSYDYPAGTTDFEIDVSSFEVGIYFLKINNKLFKFIKLR